MLEFGVSQDDREGQRGAENGAFFNYQGRKLTDLPDGNWLISADFYIPSTIPSTVTPLNIGMWANAGPSFPSIVYRQGDTIDDGLYIFESSNPAWVPLLTSDDHGDNFRDQWLTFRMELDVISDQFTFTAADATGALLGSITTTASGSQNYTELLLNMWNPLTGDAGEPEQFSVFVDNVTYTPEPSPAFLLWLALGSLLLRRRRASGCSNCH